MEDVSIRRRALNLLYTMCDRRSARVIVEQLLLYLRHLVKEDHPDFALRAELVLKIAILAEKYSVGLKERAREGLGHKWYVDVMLQVRLMLLYFLFSLFRILLVTF